ncbi:hypothetical protein TH66_15895 [Carbonactinospora thermoautotrophica]|uniref:Carboxyltransferase domain-containing protein n=1 Tax=Carbonactinospora thermoautotrophica TaxID=1469144 RepID=A0A132NCF8_9ACTN|nr:carboxyltransferase domain-containing protein [Carbonactinospora thermoautotrophica]KWX00314.1 hypothetical protein TH66_15895 [Carbonactinospora thermoautotrophica]KWX07851.1 hypothetical protein TR74_17360 [Carbonactinospora thermoautotrophica]
MKIRRVGWTGLRVEPPSSADVPRLAAEIRRRRNHGELSGLAEIVPAAHTLLLVAHRGSEELLDRLARELPTWDLPHARTDGSRLHRIPVRFDGADLDEIAARVGLSRDRVIAHLLRARLRVAFLGFSPGWAYIEGVPAEIQVPRRDSPRTRVPGGSVCIANGYLGIYARPSPSGWWIVGTTDVPVWNLEADPPALFGVGDRVQLVEAP